MRERYASICMATTQKGGYWFLLLLVGTLVLLAACRGSSSGGVPHAPTLLIQTATARVHGKAETILTSGYSGFTLYYRVSDRPPTVVCSAACAKTWPPFNAPLYHGTPETTPLSPALLPSKVSVQMTINGPQFEYNGHPLYTYSGDMAVGQTTGEGIGGVWHVATPSLS